MRGIRQCEPQNESILTWKVESRKRQMKKHMMRKYTATQQRAESALAVVMAKWGKEAIAERDALQKRLDELKRIYPTHFLSED